MIHIQKIAALLGALTLAGTLAGCAADSTSDNAASKGEALAKPETKWVKSGSDAKVQPADNREQKADNREQKADNREQKADSVKADTIRPMVSLSFFNSCTDPYAEGQGDAATYASASSCQRRDGSWTGFVSWSGYCTGDISNNDGSLECN